MSLRSLLLPLLLLALGVPAPVSAAALAVPTFESLGLYWTPPANPGAAGCQVRYRRAGDTEWRAGYPMKYDDRSIGGRSSRWR